MRVILSSCRNPWLNLALENSLLLQSAQEELLLLWQSRRAVVIGRNQNIWCDISLRYLRTHRIAAVRRESGGGAVYHDNGNLNFALFSPRGRWQPERNFNFLVAILHSMGIKAKQAANSIMVGGYKISGSAFRFSRHSVMHHGTLLVNANTAHLQKVLKPDNHIQENTGVHSRRASVVNISSLQRSVNVKRLQARFVENVASWQAEAMAPAIERHDEAALRANTALQAQAAQLQRWEWLVGRSPRCTLTIKLPQQSYRLYLHLTIQWGIIEALTLHSSLSIRREIEKCLQKSLIGCRIDSQLPTELKTQFAQCAKDLGKDNARAIFHQLQREIEALIIPNV